MAAEPGSPRIAQHSAAKHSGSTVAGKKVIYAAEGSGTSHKFQIVSGIQSVRRAPFYFCKQGKTYWHCGWHIPEHGAARTRRRPTNPAIRRDTTARFFCGSFESYSAVPIEQIKKRR